MLSSGQPLPDHKSTIGANPRLLRKHHLQFPPAHFPHGTGRRLTPSLLTAAGMSRLSGRAPARYERSGDQLVQRRTAAIRAGDDRAAPRQRLKCHVTVVAAILMDRQRTLPRFINRTPNGYACLSRQAEYALAIWPTAMSPVSGGSDSNSAEWDECRPPRGFCILSR